VNVVDSSGWLEYLSGGPNAAFFAPPIEDPSSLVVPTISIFEVFKRVLRERGDVLAHQVASAMSVGQLADLTAELALDAARLGVEHRLSMADSIILATARLHQAILWTQDADFVDIAGTRYVASR